MSKEKFHAAGGIVMQNHIPSRTGLSSFRVLRFLPRLRAPGLPGMCVECICGTCDPSLLSFANT